MSIVTQKYEELEDTQTAKFVTSALRDISATKIKKLKSEFNTNLSFYSEISELYLTVREEALRRAGAGSEYAKRAAREQRSGNLAVAFTSETHFYGVLNREVMQLFLDYLNDNPDYKSLVIGSTGIRYMEERGEDRNYSTMHFGKEGPTSREMRDFLKKVESYKRVYVFYPKFVNVFEQEPGMRDIAYMPEAEVIEKEKSHPKYILEPELPKILNFFETQVKYILFKRTMLETALSRTAARVIKMDKAEGKADDMMKEQRRDLQKEVAQLQGMRLLETFSGYKKWKEEKQKIS